MWMLDYGRPESTAAYSPPRSAYPDRAVQYVQAKRTVRGCSALHPRQVVPPPPGVLLPLTHAAPLAPFLTPLKPTITARPQQPAAKHRTPTSTQAAGRSSSTKGTASMYSLSTIMPAPGQAPLAQPCHDYQHMPCTQAPGAACNGSTNSATLGVSLPILLADARVSIR
ncbi:hypothetical protein K469DRAFT_697298 [Zopfia rhizophila CBS 207.26]|uniref:Uncharacterized protein n=1 Tax=Zopfia rhizophila CBS 207.26 TaxID=1314779 RepID=A0A6A6DGN9_9PEZI|nr:hypothetical protein K469DRAFT_697298 [Zopfia rhizophila CBS 207.26]